MPTETQSEVVKLSPLSATFRKMGAVIRVDHSWEEVVRFTSPQEEAATVLRTVGLADLSSIPKFDLQGGDLNSPRVLGAEAQAWRLRAGRYLVTCRPEDRGLVQDELNRYVAAAGVSSDPAYFTDVTSGYAALLLAGPRSRDVLRKLADLDVSADAFPNLACAQTGVHHIYSILMRRDIQSLRAYQPVVKVPSSAKKHTATDSRHPLRLETKRFGQRESAGSPAILPAHTSATGCYIILVNREYGEWLWETIIEAGAEFGIRPFGSAAHELLRNT